MIPRDEIGTKTDCEDGEKRGIKRWSDYETQRFKHKKVVGDRQI
jgi:hypothetical protein